MFKSKFTAIILFAMALAFSACSGGGNSDGEMVYQFSADANLASLSLDAGALLPAFDPAVTVYSVIYLSNPVASATITAAAAHSEAVVSYPGGQNPALTVGSNDLVVRVTAEDGTTIKDYTIRVYRMGTDHTSATIGALKYVPAGLFQRNAGPANIISVSALRVSSNEITRSQYSTVMGVDPADAAYSSGVSDPVQMVNWYHAIAFCNKLSIAEGLTPVYTVDGVDFTTLAHADIPIESDATWDDVSANWAASGYRLPTELEWMWAAMGANMGADPFSVNTSGYAKPFAGSAGSNDIGEYAWYGRYNGGSATTATTTVVGSKLPNALGISDMSGNVFELCWDWHGGYPAGYQADYRGAVSGTERVMRGGSWADTMDYCAVDRRSSFYPNDLAESIGFRVVRP